MSLPPDGLAGLDRRWSREVTAPDSTGVLRTWHVLDTHAGRPTTGDDAPVGTVLCVHGNPSWSYLWRRVVAQPPAGWRVVALDHLDMGFSQRTGTVRPLAQRVADLDSLTSALALAGPVVTLAHDWGGPISLGWALRHVDQLAGVILANTGVALPAGSTGPLAIRSTLLPGVLPMVTSRSRTFIRSALLLSRPVPAREIRAGFYAPYRRSADRRAIETFVRDIPLEPGHPSAAALSEIADGLGALADTPVLLLWGPRDPVFSDSYLRDLITRMPHADVHRYEGSAHLVPEDAPSFSADVASWVAQRARVPSASALGGPDGATGATVPPTNPLRQPLWAGIARRRTDEAEAVVELGPDGVRRTITFAQLDHRIQRCAAGLAGAGVRPGDRIALLVPPGVDLTVVLFGIWRAGAIAVVVDAGLGLRGMRTALRSAGPKYLVGVAKGLAAARAMGLGARLVGVGPIPRATARALGVEWTLADLELAGLDVPPEPGPDDPAVIAFTSGATGPAKGVLYLHRQLQAQRDLIISVYGITDQDSLVAAFGPFALFGAAMGIPSAVPDMDLTAPRTLTARALGDATAALGASMVFASPAALANVAATAAGPKAATPAGAAALAQVRVLLSTGAPVPVELLEELAPLLPAATAHTPYGMTEVLPVANIDLPGMLAAGAGNGVCVGQPVPATQVAISALDECGVANGGLSDQPWVTGEVCVSAAHRKERYDRLWVTEQAASRDRGWHRTGDVGHFDDEGRLWIEGRLPHVIRTADGPVTPVGIERRAESVPGVRRAAAVSVGPAGAARVVLVAEVGHGRSGLAEPALRDAVRSAVGNRVDLAAVLVVATLPVDIRHNSKIDRVRVGRWADRVLAGGRVGQP